MAHFAKIDSNNRVEDIVFVDNSITHMKHMQMILQQNLNKEV